MVRIENLTHPAVEIKLQHNGSNQRLEIPQNQTLFFWIALAVGTPERIPRIRSPRGGRLFQTGLDAMDQISLSVSIDDEPVPFLTDSFYRESDYKGLAWWSAIEPVPLPATVHVEFETTGLQPTEQEDPIVLWTEQGQPIQWGTTFTNTIELHPSDDSASKFSTKQENLWERNSVYVPR